MKSTLLAIGDLNMDEVKKAPSINRFIHYRERVAKRKIKFTFITYDDLLLGRLPDVSTKKLKIMLFFPYSHWNTNIERYDFDDRIYGDDSFGKDYKRFFLHIEEIIKHKYRDKHIDYVNPPHTCILDRDKRKTDQMLSRRGILIPKDYIVSGITQLNKILNKTPALYVKPTFGAMGKGVTYLTKKECWTNFIFRGGHIISRPYDYDWDFVKIPRRQRNNFLKILIKKKFIFEEGVKLPVLERRKFDIRVYVIYDEIPYIYAKSTPEKTFVTNWSQGGRIEAKYFLKRAVPAKKIEEIKNLAKRSAKIMDLNYAGIDIILNENLDKTYFLEAHSFPGYERGFNLMKFLIDKI